MIVQYVVLLFLFFFFFQAEDGIRDHCVTGVQTCALPISLSAVWKSVAFRPSVMLSPSLIGVGTARSTWAPCGTRPALRWLICTLEPPAEAPAPPTTRDRKSTRLNSSHTVISYAVFCLKKKNYNQINRTEDQICRKVCVWS